MSKNQLLVVAGDPSGDERAAEALRILKQSKPELSTFGIGGEHLKQEGMEQLYSLDEVTVIGFLEALINYRRLKRIFNSILEEYQSRNAVGALLVDYGGFNLRLASRLKELPGKTVYYISPQVWASRKERARTMVESVDALAVLFSFEKDFYKQYGFDAVHVGHPLLDTIDPALTTRKSEVRAGEQKHIVIMPGSRMSELTRLKKPILSALDSLNSRHDLKISFIAAQGRAQWLKDNYSLSDDQVISSEYKYETIEAADVVLVASGTAVLEVAMLGKPAVVIYKASAITGLIANMVLNIDLIALPNILAGKEIYPELIQSKCNGENISKAITQYLEDSESCDRIRQQLATVRDQLGQPGAAKRVAELIQETVNWRE